MANEHIPKRLLDIFHAHEADHTKPMTKAFHLLVNPLVLLGTLGLFSLIPLLPQYSLDGAALLLLLNFIFYVRIDWKIATIYIAVATAIYFGIRDWHYSVYLICFFLGWGLGFFSHKVYEKNKPAATNNIRDVLVSVGPLHMLAWMIGYYQPPKN